MPELKKIRVLLVDDHPLTREGIRMCLAPSPHIEIVGEVADGHAAIRSARRLLPDVVVMDVNMPGLNGLAATPLLVRQCPDARVLILTMHDQPEYVVEMIHAGARGYVSKDAAPGELVRAIEKLAAGETNFGLPETIRFLRRYRPAPSCVVAPAVHELTARERQVAVLVAEGLTTREISLRMKVGVRTVETYRERLMRKLDLHDVAAVRAYAAASGLLSLWETDPTAD